MEGAEADLRAQLVRLCRKLFANRRLIVVSNRGPMEHHGVDDGKLETKRGGGGVVTALSPIGRFVKGFTWVTCAMTRGDRIAAGRAGHRSFPVPLAGQKLSLRFITPSPAAYHKYYDVFCNSVLWFHQHYMCDISREPNMDTQTYDAWENGYVPVNRAFAEAVVAEIREAETPAVVMVQDYHLYLVPGYIRSEIPDVILQHFIHIPWPGPRYWLMLPSVMRRSIVEGLCAADIVGLQTRRDVRNFLQTCEFVLDGAEVDYQNSTIKSNEHLTKVTLYPVSVDVFDLRTTALYPEVREYEKRLRPCFGKQTVVRVDRADLSKNIIRGLKAYRILLERHPEFRKKVKLIHFLVPTRSDVEEYQKYAEEIMGLVAAINNEYGDEEWQPIKVFYENNYLQAIAGMRHYDVLLVNSVIDGMNLVAKEGPTVNICDGVLVLSESAGAHEQLEAHVLSVTPTDIEGTVRALYQALTMPPEERKARAEALRSSIRSEDLTLWLYQQFRDIQDLVQG